MCGGASTLQLGRSCQGDTYGALVEGGYHHEALLVRLRHCDRRSGVSGPCFVRFVRQRWAGAGV